MPRGIYERKTGLTRNTPPRFALAQRFADKVDKTEDCWLWRGFIDKAGYGRIRIGGRSTPVGYAHRVSYELARGPIPSGLALDHLCRVRHCVNPDHLEAVTLAENTRRMPVEVRGRGGVPAKPTCGRGHDRSQSYYRNGKVVYCRICRREARKALRAFA